MPKNGYEKEFEHSDDFFDFDKEHNDDLDCVFQWDCKKIFKKLSKL